jgi:hypothetical protein
MHTSSIRYDNIFPEFPMVFLVAAGLVLFKGGRGLVAQSAVQSLSIVENYSKRLCMIAQQLKL